MSTLTTILAILVALEHLYIMFLETIATSSEIRIVKYLFKRSKAADAPPLRHTTTLAPGLKTNIC